ncbi:alpha/beta hydrolase [Peptococcus simiae]|uniref:alpha/beta hydrolase n=1 Tax=Peptococcus simiae TaxID=1643805 RepID=UPI003980D16A
MSLSYRLLAGLVRLSGVKRVFRKPAAEILAYAKRQNARKPFRPDRLRRRAAQKGYTCLLEDIAGYPCIRFQPCRPPQAEAILYLYGGGMITGPDRLDFSLAERLMARTGKDVWLPLYPLCLDQSVARSYTASLAVYERMLATYPARGIRVLGFSSGAVLALGIFLLNNDLGRPLPMAQEIIAVSPGGLPDPDRPEDQALLADLARYSERDVLIDAAYFQTARQILKREEDLPDFMLDGRRGDFTDFPPTYFYYGSHECLYAYAPYFKAAYDRYQRPCQVIVGPGLCHCYPLMRFFKEGRQAQEEIIRRLQYRLTD